MKGKNKDQANQNQTLSFPDVTPFDYLKLCPRYASGN